MLTLKKAGRELETFFLRPHSAIMINSGAALWNYFERWSDGPKSNPDLSVTAQFASGFIRVSLHGAGLARPYTRALSQAEKIVGAEQYFEIHIIDGAACGLELPRLGWTASDFGLKRQIPGWSNAELTVYLLLAESGVSVANWQKRKAFVWIPSHRAVPWWERAAPLRWLLDGLAEKLGMVTLHAAVVGSTGRGVIFGGVGGSGKSTLALACVENGMDYVGDDYCLLAMDREPLCMNLYSTAKLHRGHVTGNSLIENFSSASVEKPEEKNIIFLNESHPTQVVTALKIQAILLPQFSDGIRFERVSPEMGMRQLAPSTVSQSEAAGPHLVRQLALLARAVPVYRFHMPPDVQRCAGAVANFIARFPNETRAE